MGVYLSHFSFQAFLKFKLAASEPISEIIFVHRRMKWASVLIHATIVLFFDSFQQN